MVETSVVLLSYNGKHLLKTCLPPLLKQTYKDYELILVDNGSTDGTMEWIEKKFPRSKYPQLHAKYLFPNRGFTGGNNYGVESARGKYIVLLSNDAVASPDWLATLIAGMKRSGFDIATSVNLNAGFERGIADLLDKKGTYYTMNLVGENVAVRVPKEELDRKAIRTFYSAGNAFCYRRGTFKNPAVPFDQILFIYAEDVYACWRARLKGASVGYITDSRIQHGFSVSKKTSKEAGMVASFNGMKNQLLNYALFYKWYNLLRMLPLLCITQFAHVMYNPRAFKTKFKVYWWLLKNIPIIVRKRREMQRTRRVPDKKLIAEMSYKFFDDPLLRFSRPKRIACAIMNGCFWLYCVVFRIKTREFQ